MTILPITLFGHPILRQKSKRVRGIDVSIQKLIDDMHETLEAAHGVGLAAPQVGLLLRVIVIHIPEQEPLALINPQVVRKRGERVVPEGCLSLPGYRGEVKRSETVTVKGLDPQGMEIRIKADELLAQALEHEIDHLNGILFVDHLVSPDGLWKIEPEEEPDEEEAVPAGARQAEL